MLFVFLLLFGLSNFVSNKGIYWLMTDFTGFAKDLQIKNRQWRSRFSRVACTQHWSSSLFYDTSDDYLNKENATTNKSK